MSRSKPNRTNAKSGVSSKPASSPVSAASSSPLSHRSSAEESLLMSGLTSFHTHHQSVYRTRWLSSLYPALLLPHPSVAVLNSFLPSRTLDALRANLKERGAVRWVRRGEGEIEAWRFEEGEATGGAGEGAATEDDALAQRMGTSALNDSAFSSSASVAASPSPASSIEGIIGRFLPPTPLDPSSPLLPYYLLDGASLLAVDALQLSPNHVVLDLCAAPGGKSVCAAMHLDLLNAAGAGGANGQAAPAASIAGTLATAAPVSQLHANEPQQSRRLRLQSVLDEFIPPTVRRNRARIEVTSWDGTRIALPQCKYDRVLVDAPCSSDRHVLQSAKELTGWNAKRIKINAERQVLLLLNALRATKIGGICVYATCSLSRKENDGVIEEVLAKIVRNRRNGGGGGNSQLHVQVLPIRSAMERNISQLASSNFTASAVASDSNTSTSSTSSASPLDDVLYFPMGESTKYGWMILPDQILHNPSIPSVSSSSAPSNSPVSTHTPVGHGFGPLFFCRIKRVAKGGQRGDDEEEEEEESSEEEESEGEIEPRRKPDRQLPEDEAEGDSDE